MTRRLDPITKVQRSEARSMERWATKRLGPISTRILDAAIRPTHSGRCNGTCIADGLPTDDY